jgi:hypothetical protein
MKTIELIFLSILIAILLIPAAIGSIFVAVVILAGQRIDSLNYRYGEPRK